MEELETRLRKAGDKHRATRDSLHNARTQLLPLIEEAIRAGMQQAKIVRLSGYTREHIRRIERRLQR